MTPTLKPRTAGRALGAIMRSRPAVAATSAALAVAVLGGTAAMAAHDPNVIHACKKNNNGSVRLVSSPSDCNGSETAMEWNQRPCWGHGRLGPRRHRRPRRSGRAAGRDGPGRPRRPRRPVSIERGLLGPRPRPGGRVVVLPGRHAV